MISACETEGVPFAAERVAELLVELWHRARYQTVPTVSDQQMRVLIALDPDGRTLTDLAHYLGLGASSATRLCDRLEQQNLLRRIPQGRRVLIALTPAGHDVLATARAHLRRFLTPPDTDETTSARPAPLNAGHVNAAPANTGAPNPAALNPAALWAAFLALIPPRPAQRGLACPTPCAPLRDAPESDGPYPPELRSCEGHCHRLATVYLVQNPLTGDTRLGTTSGDPRPALRTHHADGFRRILRCATGLPPDTAPAITATIHTALRTPPPTTDHHHFASATIPTILATLDRELRRLQPAPGQLATHRQRTAEAVSGGQIAAGTG